MKAVEQEADEDYVLKLQEKLSESYGKLRDIGHVSDVNMCLRLRVFEQLDKNPPKISAKKLGFFTSGKSIHEAIQYLYLSDRKRFEKEKWIEHEGIVGHVDVYDRKKHAPIELKTYRGDKVLNNPIPYNVEQLKYYIAMLDSDKGYIIYQFLNQSKMKLDEQVVFKQFKVEMSKAEKQYYLNKMVSRMKQIKQGIKLKDPSVVEAVYDDYNLRWLCYECPYLEPCKEMRPKPEEQESEFTV